MFWCGFLRMVSGGCEFPSFFMEVDLKYDYFHALG